MGAYQSRGNSRRVRMTIMVLPDLKKDLTDVAESTDRSMGYLVEQAIREYLRSLATKANTS